MRLYYIVLLISLILFIESIYANNHGIKRISPSDNRAKRKKISRRRLETQTDFEYATQTEIVISLQNTTKSSEINQEADIETAFKDALELSDSTQVDTAPASGGESWKISIWNEGTNFKTASEIASAQVNAINFSEAEFLSRFAATVSYSLGASDFKIDSLGYIIVWLDGSGADKSFSTSDTLTLAGTIVYWPYWMWILFSIIVVCVIIPYTVLIFSSKLDEPVFEAASKREKFKLSFTQIYFGPTKASK